MSKARLMQGNEACAEGALAAGVRFFGGYPITPSTEIAEGMAKLLPKVGGKFIALKGSSLNEELSQANYAIQLLGGKTKDIQKIYVKQIDATRENLTIEKVKPTDKKYPRGKNLPRLKPLVASQQ